MARLRSTFLVRTTPLNSLRLFCVLAVAVGCGNRGHSRDASNPSAADAADASVADAARDDHAAEPGADGPVPDANVADSAPSERDRDAVLRDDKDAGDAAAEAPASLSGTRYRAIAISAGTLHVCAILDDHRLKCWGSNFMGAVGSGTGMDDSVGDVPAETGDGLPFVDLGTGRTAVAVSGGRYFTCALLDDGTVKCWGWWQYAGLGEVGQNRGEDPDQLGDHLPPLNLGAGRHATRIQASYSNTCATLDDGTITCWGASGPTPTPGALPGGHVTALGRGPFALLQDGDAFSLFGPIRPGPESGLKMLPAGEAAVYVASTNDEACVVTQAGKLDCGVGPDLPHPPASTTGLVAYELSLVGEFGCGLFQDGTVRCWGMSGCQADPPDAICSADRSITLALGQRAVALAGGGSTFICGLLADGTVKCWDNGTDKNPRPNILPKLSIDLGTHP